jgi:hypothetical protein
MIPAPVAVGKNTRSAVALIDNDNNNKHTLGLLNSNPTFKYRLIINVGEAKDE